MSFHGGAEGRRARTCRSPKRSTTASRAATSCASRARSVDAGADLVIGHGPHVVRADGTYKDRLIAYSLGNFATYYGISVAGIKGYGADPRPDAGRDGTLPRGPCRVDPAILAGPDARLGCRAAARAATFAKPPEDFRRLGRSCSPMTMVASRRCRAEAGASICRSGRSVDPPPTGLEVDAE